MGHTEAVFAAEISPNLRWVVTGGSEQGIHIWDLAAVLATAASATTSDRSVGADKAFRTAFRHPRLFVDGSESSNGEATSDTDSDGATR